MLQPNLKDKIIQVVMSNGQIIIGKCHEYVEHQKLVMENPQMLAVTETQMGFVPVIITKEKKPLVPIGYSNILFGPILADAELSQPYLEQFSGIITNPNKFII
jgi:hypothetical protein